MEGEEGSGDRDVGAEMSPSIPIDSAWTKLIKSDSQRLRQEDKMFCFYREL